MAAPKVDTKRSKGPLVLKVLCDTFSHNKTLYTQDDWHIEADFIITYDVHGFKRAHKIPKTAKQIIEGPVQDDINGISGTALEG
jgi:hypothetical protein